MNSLPRRTGLAGLAAIASVAALVPASSAVAAPVGQLDWTLQNSYGPGGATANVNRTWLGYVTNSPAPMGANGTVTPSAGAFGPTVTPASLRGATVFDSFGFALDDTETGLASGANTLQFEGTITFASPAAPAGHGFTSTIVNPRIELNTTTGTGKLYATGSNAGTAYDATTASVFDLNLATATYRTYADGSTVVSCITPSITQAGYAFPGNYAAGAGPERTPNTFGTFAIRLADDATAPATPNADWANSCAPQKGDKGDKGDAGTPGTNGTDGTDGTNGTDGTDGADGVDGKNGADGAPGAQGPQGPAGANGGIGPVGPAGAQGPAGPAGAKGATGARGKTGPRGPRGPRGRSVVRRASLARAAFAGTKTRTVKITRRGSKTVVATGTVKGRTLTYKATKKLTGKVVLRSGGRAVTVTVK